VIVRSLGAYRRAGENFRSIWESQPINAGIPNKLCEIPSLMNACWEGSRCYLGLLGCT